MLTIKSEKASLSELSIEELRHVAWHRLDMNEFIEDLNDIQLLARLRYADREALAGFHTNGEILKHMNEDALTMVINAKSSLSPRGNWWLSSGMWNNDKQYSLEFLSKNVKHIDLAYVWNQKCITPEFLEKFSSLIHFNSFFDNFVGTRDVETFNNFSTYKDGMFMRHIMQSRNMRYMTQESLITLGIDVPEYYDTVITEQRIMSGEPCNDGQRSFTIWLRKFRRVTGRQNDYPTWNEMLELLKTHPRLNSNSYVDWIYSRCLENTDEELSRYPTQLSYRAKNINQSDYRTVTGTSGEQSENDFNIEFSDVIEQPVQQDSTENVERQDEVLTVDLRVTPATTQTGEFFHLTMPSFLVMDGTNEDYESSDSDEPNE